MLSKESLNLYLEVVRLSLPIALRSAHLMPLGQFYDVTYEAVQSDGILVNGSISLLNEQERLLLSVCLPVSNLFRFPPTATIKTIVHMSKRCWTGRYARFF